MTLSRFTLLALASGWAAGLAIGRLVPTSLVAASSGSVPPGTYYLTNHDGIFAPDKPAAYRLVQITPDQHIVKVRPGVCHTTRDFPCEAHQP